jgi:predicted DNA-binding transcriptional regulator AlpA
MSAGEHGGSPNKLMTFRDARARCGVSRPTAYVMIAQRKFPPVLRIGSGRGRLFVREAAFLEWLRSLEERQRSSHDVKADKQVELTG